VAYTGCWIHDVVNFLCFPERLSGGEVTVVSVGLIASPSFFLETLWLMDSDICGDIPWCDVVNKLVEITCF